MRVTSRLSAAVPVLLGALLTVSGCGAMQSTGVGAKLPVNEAQLAQGRSDGSTDTDDSPREVTGAGTSVEKPDEEEPSPEPKRPALDIPEEPYPAPDFPDPPAADSPELDRIEYVLKKVAWTSAGFVGEDTESDCSIDEDELIDTGTYDFTCSVSFAETTTTFDVHAEVQSKQVPWEYHVKKLPISEEKAVYEATRQAYKPAIVTCDIVDTELVRVGQESGLTCWVTDINDERSSYRGELQEDGTLAFPLTDD